MKLKSSIDMAQIAKMKPYNTDEEKAMITLYDNLVQTQAELSETHKKLEESEERHRQRDSWGRRVYPDGDE
jgi:hypothetical protein